ncbi:hypothetical protein VAPA_1c44740 [Variovorax paradoxus B4]|uniref:Uncharacterized protein n=1 Tax=Variovorax paradoxus B4 TaxID=1246301 RepID=T1XF36_VARPD|nr:hypothetical protein [Variovorax paradoxus]AGU51547.1 hypothetical protein VAPA_1c44740 [Variovorax paradoxus B4]
MATNSWPEILSTCDEIEQLLDGAAPVADSARLNRITFLCGHLGTDSYIRQKANRLASRAAIYFSARRHASEQGGAAGVMQEMRYRLLSSIREQADWLARSQS